MAEELNPPEPAAPPLAETLERVDHAIALADAAGRLRWCNPPLTDCYLDCLASDVLGLPAAEVLRPLFGDPAQWARVESALERLGRTPKERIEIANLSFGRGRRAMRRIDLVLCELNSATAERWVAWYFYDTTAWRRADENLQTLLRHSSDGIFMIDADCRLRVFNEACERITGLAAEDVLRRETPCSAIFECQGGPCSPGAGAVAEPGASAPVCFLKGGPHQTRELPIRTHDGAQLWVEISYAPVLDEMGRIAYVLGILRDVTQRRALEEQLRLTRKLATLGELTSAMAHEIKNPLGIILSAAEIIMNSERNEEDRRQAAEFIRDEAKRLDERMSVFLNFSRPRPPEFRVQSIHRVLMQTIIAYETLARPGLAIWTDFGPCLPHVRIDADQMQQVFLNLLMNADQAMPTGGTITISTRPGAEEGWVAVEVADEGHGLPEAEIGMIFEPFYSTKPRGTGLGLAIVVHIVTAHGGRVAVRNREGGGAAFTISLPGNAE